jgi:hypothetical protein
MTAWKIVMTAIGPAHEVGSPGRSPACTHKIASFAPQANVPNAWFAAAGYGFALHVDLAERAELVHYSVAFPLKPGTPTPIKNTVRGNVIEP